MDEETSAKRGRPKGFSPQFVERNTAIKARYLAGETLAAIGESYGITRERARQILVKQGVGGFDGGAAVRWETQRLERTERRMERYMRKYGCTPEQYVELRDISRKLVEQGVKPSKTPIGAYRNRKHNCSQHGIPFDLKLWEFWTVWIESGHWHDRGQGRYGLCRKDTSKGFTKDNVFIRQMSRESRWGEKRSGPASKFKPVSPAQLEPSESVVS